MKRAISLLCILLLSTFALAQISGDYIETRSADVYTGACFANGEVNLVGDQAILGWRIERGAWNSVPLDGLSVVAVVKARATLGDPYGKPYPAKAVVIVDDHANPYQRAALIDFARHIGGKLLSNVVGVASVPIEITVAHNPAHHGAALLRAGELATVRTRPINSGDHICGNEETYYPPLTPLAHSMPAVALTDEFRGPGLGVEWTTHDKRSAFVGSFAEPATGY